MGKRSSGSSTPKDLFPQSVKIMFKILHSQRLVPNIHLLTIKAAEVARALDPGNFVILRPNEEGERIPLTPSNWNIEEGTITIVFMMVGSTTHQLASLHAGDDIPTVVGPLGNPIDLPEGKNVLLVGGCYGIGSLYPIAKTLREKGNRVIVVLEARSKNLFYWLDQWESIADKLILISRDGTKGLRGHVYDNLPGIINSLPEIPDLVIANGCNYQMKRTSDATQTANIKTLVSLNTLMIDGTGMCGVCRVSIAGEMKFACVDGPYFDGHQVNWDELAKRRRSYLPEETIPFQTSRAEVPIHSINHSRLRE